MEKEGLGRKILIGILVLLAVATFVNFCSHAIDTLQGQNDDPITYYQKAQQLASRQPGSIDDYFSPGYTILLGTWMQVFGTSLSAAKALGIVAGALLIIVVYLIAKTIFNSRSIGVLSSFILAFDPELRFYAVNLYKEVPLILAITTITLIAAVLAHEELKQKWRYALYGAFGLLLGASIYINAWVLAFFLLLGYPIIHLKLTKQKINWNDRIREILVALAGFFIVVILINIIFFIPLFGRPVVILTNGGLLLYFGNNPSPEANVAYTSTYTSLIDQPISDWAIKQGIVFSNLTNQESSKYYTEYVLQFWAHNPSYLLNRVTKSFFSYWLFPNSEYSQRLVNSWTGVLVWEWILWVLAIIGLCIIILQGIDMWLGTIVIAYPMLVVTAAVLLTIYLMRYKLYLLPGEAIIAAVTLSTALQGALSAFEHREEE